MNIHSRDYDDVLRRALHAAAESVEPSPDGLERIRARMKTPSVLSFASVVAWCQEAATMVVGWAAPLIRTALDAFWSVIDHFRPASAVPSESGSRSGWIRPLVAMGTAIFVVAAGAFAVLTLPHAISPNNASFFSLPWTHPTSAGGGGGRIDGGGVSGNSSSQTTGGASNPGSSSFSGTSSVSPAASQCSPLGSSGRKTLPPVILTPSSTPPATSTTPPASTPPASTPPTTTPPAITTTPPVSVTPDPGSASTSTPAPAASSQAGSTAGLDASTSQTVGPKESAMVPSGSPSVTPPSIPCESSPAKAKKNGASTVSGGLSAYGALEFRVTVKAAGRD